MTSTRTTRRGSFRRSIRALFFVSVALCRPAAAVEDFVRGDVNASGRIDISDPIAVLGCLFSGEECPPCQDSSDANDSGKVDISDAMRILGFLYLGDPPLPPPNTCGPDPTADDLSCDAYPLCPVEEPVEPVKYFWPLPGVDGRDWVITRYVDVDRTAGRQRDYSGATGGSARTSDQHNGTDIDIANFRAMDAGVPVLAAADGVVVAVHDGEPDRNTSGAEPCKLRDNFLIIEHADGTRTRYGKLKKDSIAVAVGSPVQAGDEIAEVGSSGCSSQPQLHFEVSNRAGNIIDPFRPGRWVHPPAYQSPLSIMKVSLKPGGFDNLGEVMDPPSANIAETTPGSTFGIGLSLANGSPSEPVQVQVRKPGGFPMVLGNVIPDAVERHSFHRFHVEPLDTGDWTLIVLVNGDVRHQSRFAVHYPTGHQVFSFEMNESQLKDSLEDKEFRPVAADGFSFGSGALFNVVWERAPGARWTLMYNIPGGLIGTLINTNTQMGFRVIDLDSYRVGNTVMFLALMTDEPGPEQELLLGVPEPALRSFLQNASNRGFFPVDLSIVDLGNGIQVGTALCLKRAARDLIYMYDLTSSQYQSMYTQQNAQGLRLLNLNGYNTDAGAIRFAAIWDSRDTGELEARHDMDKNTLAAHLVDIGLQRRLKTRFITGYGNRSNPFNVTTAFAALWSQR